MQLPDLRDYRAIVCFTGAGMSVESGVPASPPHGDWPSGIAQVTQDDFDYDPEAVWALHNQLRAQVQRAAPHAGHAAISQLQQTRPRLAVITQNIDGLHQRAGTRDVVELHGSLWRVRCRHCLAEEACEEVPRTRLRCEHCLGWWRPDVVWTGDVIAPKLRAHADNIVRGCDLLIIVGVSGRVFPAATLPELACSHGARCIVIDPHETPFSRHCEWHLRAPASVGLDQLAR